MNFDVPTPADGLPVVRDWDWLAFRYVSGEMNGDEAGQFEGCLAEEQVAREAVATAVMLLEAAPLAAGDGKTTRTGQETSPTVAADKPNNWRQKLAWAGVGAAASAAVILATTGNHPTRHRADRSAGIANTANSNVDRLALTWSSLADDDSDSPADESDDAVAQTAAPDADTTGSAQDIVEQLSAPGWLMTAVAHQDMPQNGDAHDVEMD